MSHTSQIITHLKQHGSITGLQALRHYDCFRLAARIYDIRNLGYVVDSQKWKTRSGKTVARYWLKGE